MGIKQQFSQIVSTAVAMLQTRLELASVELEEELNRFASWVVGTLIALFCAGVALSLLIILVIALFWDDHRVAVLLILIALFGGISASIAFWLKRQVAGKPRLFEQSMAELRKDAELLRQERTEPEQP